MDELAIKNYRSFRSIGLNNELTDKDKSVIYYIDAQLKYFNKRLTLLQNVKKDAMKAPGVKRINMKGESYVRKLLAVDVDYPSQLDIIFSHGKSNYTIWFLNRKKEVCCIDKCVKAKNGAYCVAITLDLKNRRKKTKMYLDRFLYLVETNEFTIVNKKFNEYYMKPYEESQYVQNKLKTLNLEIEAVLSLIDKLKASDDYIKYSSWYKDSENEVNKNYKKAIKDLKRKVPQDKSKQLVKKKEKLDNNSKYIKDIWNSTISESDKAYMIGWICKHIKNIKIKTVKEGVSDQILTLAFPDEKYGMKYREKPNTSGWDASSGIITFDNTENAPIENIKKLSTVKHIQHTKNKGETIFNKNKISNLDLALFLLNEYNDYGLKSSLINLNKHIDVAKLKNEKFSDFKEAFESGYSS